MRVKLKQRQEVALSDYLSYLQEPKVFLFDGCKLLWHQDKLQDYLDGKRISPIHIDMGIHKSCNIRCIYCYGIKQKPSRKFIPQDRLLLLAQDAKSIGVRSLAIIGDGEPTLNVGLYPFVQKLKQLGLDCSVATNGLLLDEGKTDILTSCLTWLRFNVSAVSKYDEIHGTMGGFEVFEKVVRTAVRMSRSSRCTVGLQMVLIPQCFDQVIPLAERAVDWGVDYLVIKQFSDPEEAIPVKFDMDEYDRVVGELSRAERMSNERTKIIVKWSAISDTRSITKHHRWGFDRCIDLPFIFQISGDGGCYPCGYLFGNREFCYGNVCVDRLSDIVNSKQYWDIVRKVSNTPLSKLCKGQCRHCETNKFIDRLMRVYTGDLREALIKMCGSEEAYERMMRNPPMHVNFV